MQAALVRQKFRDYFVARGHQPVPSASLVPGDDPTLLFTNAGMVQFKRVFQGLERRDYRRAVTCQKCVRAGGKHNDLEQVGHTARHHTFFEMLGNFSFGDYFKRDAIAYAWEWVTSDEWLGIHPDRVFVTVHHSDDESRRLWREITGIADHRIFGLGDKDNFWQMGDTGPCGPCSEVMVDVRDPKARGTELSHDDFVRLNDAGELLEIWNLVFMQFDQQADGQRTPLPAPSVDTGAGLERIAAMMQGVPSNFDTDLFTPIIRRAVEVVGRDYDPGPTGAPFRVLADHARATAFLLADGVYPASDGRGYVLRRILRRAVRHAWLLGRTEPTLVELARVVVEQMGDIYPELVTRREHIEKIVRAEEERFLETIDGGLRRLDELRAVAVIPGADAFRLYDTYGFPLDLTQMIARERGQEVDVAGFERALGQQRRRSRAARSGERHVAEGTVPGGSPHVIVPPEPGAWVTLEPQAEQRWVGYATTREQTRVLAFRQSGDVVELILRDNPFYVESGGQVDDTGVVAGVGWELAVEDVERVDGRSAVVGHLPDRLDIGREDVVAQVHEVRRRNIERNHTATHLVHAALRRVLGEHVRQAGSVVAPDRLRFDFSHHGNIADDLLGTIEEEVNSHIWANLPVETREMAYGEAIAAGAMAFFTEKYGDVVRVVDVPGVSLELCGGTHVRSTGEIGLFRFTHEVGAAAGVRRIEAITGPTAYRHGRELERRLGEAAGVLKAHPEHLARRIEGLLAENRKLERRVEDLLTQGAAGATAGEIERVGDVELHLQDTDLEDRDQIGLVLDAFRGQHRRAIAVLFASGGRPGIHVTVTDDLVAQGVKAPAIANAIASVTGGRGGGRPHFASAGVGDATQLPAARQQAPRLVRELLAR